MRFPRSAVLLLALSSLAAQDADRAVLRLMEGKQRRILHRASVSPELDLVVTAAGLYLGSGDAFYWNQETALGLFLQQRNNPGRVYRIAEEHGRADDTDELLLERATASEVVFSCTPFKGRRCPNLKFAYDMRAKALVKRMDTGAFAMYRVFLEGQKAVLAGADATRLVAVEYRPSIEKQFRILEGAAAPRYTNQFKTMEGVAGLGAQQHREIIVLRPEPPSLSFGPGSRFTLAVRNQAGNSVEDLSLVVTEKEGDTVRRFPLPQSTYDEFAKARPARAKDGYVREHTRIEEHIGPVEIAGGTLWLAKVFYDAEGTTGVGGFGFFDPVTRRYVLFSPPEVKDYSASALLVEPETVWLGLTRGGEYRGFPGGLLRFDRTTHTAAVISLPELIFDIARLGSHLVMATEFGIAVYDGASLRRYFVDETTSGRLRIVEALPAKTQ